MPRVSQAETWELVASKLWEVCYPAELQRPAPLRVCPDTSGRIAEFSEHEAD